MKVTVSDILQRAGEQLRLVAAPAVLVYLLLVAFGTVVDAELAGPEMSDFLNLPLSIAMIAAQFGLTRAALSADGYDVAGGFWRFFFLSLLLSIVIGIGLVFLIVPGVILIVRLSAAVPALFAEDLAIGEAMSASWERTGEIFWPLLLAISLVWVPTALFFGWAVFGSLEGLTNPVGVLIFNLGWNAVMIAGWFFSLAAYRITTTSPSVAEVFA